MPRPNLTQLIEESRVRLRLETAEKSDLLRELAMIFALDDPQLDLDAITERLLAREALGTTGLGSGVAIPHGRIPGLDSFRIALAIEPSGIPFDAVDGEPVSIFVAILAPASQDGAHLRLLAEVSRVLRPNSMREALLAAKSPAEVVALFDQH